MQSMRRGCTAVLAAAFLTCVQVATAIDYGERPGQYRDSAFSSFGHHGKKCTNDPRMWPDKYKKSQAEIDKLAYIFVAPGTREAMALHKSDVSLKKLKKAKRARSLSIRTRSSSVGRSKSRKESVSEVALNNKAQLLAYLDDPARSKTQLFHILRFKGVTKEHLAPAGLWTAKSRPHSLLPDQLKIRKLTMRKKLQALRRKGKTLRGEKKVAAKTKAAKRSKSVKSK